MRLYGILAAAALATFSVTMPATAAPSVTATTGVFDVTKWQFTSPTVDFEATHFLKNTNTAGNADGVTHEDEDTWDAEMTVRTAEGNSLTCWGEVDRAQSSESPDTAHIVVNLTFGSVPCGKVDLTFVVDGSPPIVSASADVAHAGAEVGDVDGDGLPDVIVRGNLDVGAGTLQPATVSGTIDSPFTGLPEDATAFMKNARGGEIRAYADIAPD